MTDVSAVRHRLARPSVAESLAGALRRHIVSGELRDGDTLPKQDDLLAQYGVGRTTLRQALRILENEGLITVRRGNSGGAIVHVPQAQDAARTFGLVLQARRVPLEDLALALRRLEPVCAALCAERADRAEEVVPVLTGVLDGSEDELDDADAFLARNRRFHEALVTLCGNETMRIVLGSVESLWTAQEPDWTRNSETAWTREDRAGSVRAHRAVLEAIEAGDADRAYHLTARHLRSAQASPLQEPAPRTVEVLDPVDGRPRIT
jgi:DNA-binding FadR family transcriptional regulator